MTVKIPVRLRRSKPVIQVVKKILAGIVIVPGIVLLVIISSPWIIIHGLTEGANWCVKQWWPDAS